MIVFSFDSFQVLFERFLKWIGSEKFYKVDFFFIHSDCEFNWKYYNFGTVHF